MKNQDTTTGEKIDFPKELLEQARSAEPEGNIEKNNNNIFFTLLILKRIIIGSVNNVITIKL